MPAKRALVLDPKDNVATVVEEVQAGEEIATEPGDKAVTAKEMIPYGFKVALTDIPKGGDIVKYGELIGRASKAIVCGDMVHIHNVEGTRGRGDLVKGDS
jgi:altronate dehydratase small subunit